jgi:hypothetical protein
VSDAPRAEHAGKAMTEASPPPPRDAHARDVASLVSGHEVLAVALAIALAVALVQTLRLWWRRASLTYRLRARASHALDGEERAHRLLRGLGYDVVARQAWQPWSLRVDGVPMRVDLRADYLVERGGRTFVAEVKTGRFAPRIESPATRRQLLEYRFAFDVDGVLLVDVDAARVREIEFALPSSAPRRLSFTWSARRSVVLLALVLVIGAALGAAGAIALSPGASPI